MARWAFARCAVLVLVLEPLASTSTAAENASEPYGAEDFGAQQHTVRIPEPLVFDLVRPLGALQGELEVNNLALFPTNDTDSREIEWAPEIEYALLDGVALEFELPLEGSRIESYKLAGQLTFGTLFGERYIHGAQFIGEKLDSVDVWELTGLYLAGLRLDDRWSALGMIGYRSTAGADAPGDNEFLANLTLFADLGLRTSAGLETNWAVDGDARWVLLLMPQVHYELTDHVEVQAGLGGEFAADRADGTASLRVIYSR